MHRARRTGLTRVRRRENQEHSLRRAYQIETMRTRIAIEFFLVDSMNFLSLIVAIIDFSTRVAPRIMRFVARDSAEALEPESLFERVAHRLRVRFPAGRLHHLTHKPTQHAGLRFGLFGLVRIGCDDRIDGAVDCADVRHLAQTMRFDERARISAAIIREQPNEQILGDLAGDDAFADEIDEARQRRRA
jgi:hypothetical protein